MTSWMRFSLSMLSAALLLLPACDGDGRADPGPVEPILAVNGTISAAGRDVVPAYGVAGINPSGSAGVIMSDAPLGCLALTAEYTSSSMPLAGTYLAVGIPNFDPGVAEKSFVYFTVVPEKGTDLGGGGSNTGTVEVLDASETAVTIRVEYNDTLSDGDYVVSGDFSATLCP